MHKHVLTPQQIELLPLIKEFAKEYYLVGGTAVALYLGHRRSIDFDLFTNRDIKRKRIKRLIEQHNFQTTDILYETSEQLHIVVNSVKMTFFQFPHHITHSVNFEGIIQIPSLLDLAAMKAYALGGRAKWKDYVDLYFLLKDHFSLQEISHRAKDVFGSFFNEKLFREQLAYFKDIDYREQVEFVGTEVGEKEIKEFLTEIAITPF
jgi:hypothetical protein